MRSFVSRVFSGGLLIRVRGGVRARDGVGDGIRVRASVRAWGSFGFMYDILTLLKIKLCPCGISEKKNMCANFIQNLSYTFVVQLNPAKMDIKGPINFICKRWISVIANIEN